MDELKLLAEALEGLVACDLKIRKSMFPAAEERREKGCEDTSQRSWYLYRKCIGIITILPALFLERFTRERGFCLVDEIGPRIRRFLAQHEKLMYYGPLVGPPDHSEEQLIRTELKETKSMLLRLHKKRIITQITPEASLVSLPTGDSRMSRIFVNLWQLTHSYMDFVNVLKSIRKDKRLTKPKVNRFLEKFTTEPCGLARQLGWPEIKSQVKEIEVAIRKARKRVRHKTAHGTKEYSHGLIPLSDILNEFSHKTALLIARFPISRRLKAEAWLSSFPCTTRQYSADQFEYEALTYRLSRMDANPLVISSPIYDLWQSEFQEKGSARESKWHEDSSDEWWTEVPGPKSNTGLGNLVAMVRFAEWAEIGQFDTFFKNKLTKYERYFRSLDFRQIRRLLYNLFLGCRSQFVVKHLKFAMEASLEGIRIRYRDGITPWLEFPRSYTDESYAEHTVATACHYLFATAILGKLDNDEWLDLEAVKLILTEQNTSGWWPFSTGLESWMPSLQTTALAIQSLCLLKPKGWKLAISRGLDWLWSQQDPYGRWYEHRYHIFLPSPDAVWLTVLIMDAIDLAEGKTKLTFKLPQAVTQSITSQGTEMPAGTGQKSEAGKEQPELTDTESFILEALGSDTLKGPELLKKAGYDNSSHYRTILSNLVKRKILDRNSKGYYTL